MENRYEKFYKTDWIEVYGFWHKIIDRGQKQIEILKKIISKIDKNSIKILDVGCGEGDEINEALSKIKNKHFEIIANDASKEALEKYKKNNSSYVKRTLNEKLENLPRLLKEKFDLILFSHCLYGVNLDDLFSRYSELLKDKGIILIFLDSKDSGIKMIQDKFWKSLHEKSFDENTAEDIENNLTRKKIKYEVIEFPYYIYLNKLKQIQENGFVSLFIPFAFRTHNIKKDIIGKIISYSKTLEKDRKIKNKTLAIIIQT